MFFFWVILSQHFHIGAGAQGRSFGPFDFLIHHAIECEEIGRGYLKYSFKTRKFNRTMYTFDLDYNFKIPLDDTLMTRVTVAVLTNGGYKDNFWVKEFQKMCTTGKLFFPKIMQDIATATGRPGKVCPLPKGNFSVANIPLRVDIASQIPVFFYNKYRVDVSSWSKTHLEGCFSIFASVVPKKKAKG